MGTTLRARTFLCVGNQEEKVTEFLQRQDILPHKGADDYNFNIELKQYPECLVSLEAAGILAWNTDSRWKITSMTECGITVYYCHGGPKGGDGFVFIPMSNILAIHTVEPEDLQHIRRHPED